MDAVQQDRGEPMAEMQRGLREVVTIAAVGIALILAAGGLGKDDWAAELPYDLGIACLIVAGVKFGLRRVLTQTHRIRDFFDLVAHGSNRTLGLSMEELRETLDDPALSPGQRLMVRLEMEHVERMMRRPEEAYTYQATEPG
jgi:hypothetical protein